MIESAILACKKKKNNNDKIAYIPSPLHIDTKLYNCGLLLYYLFGSRRINSIISILFFDAIKLVVY